MSTCIFVDNSGSTCGCTEYHNAVARVLGEHGDDDVRVFYWNTVCGELGKEDVMRNSLNSKHGYGGTEPSSIVSCMVSKNVKASKLIIITDGQIGRGDVVCVASHMDAAWPCGYPVPWEEVEAHIVPPPMRRALDASVIAPFIKGVPYTIKGASGEEIAKCSLDTVRCVELIGAITDQKGLDDHFEEIRAFLAAASMARDVDYATRDALLKMRKRVIDSSRVQGHAAGSPPTVDVVEAIARDFYDTVANGGGAGRRVDQLVSLCDKAGEFSLDRLRDHKLSRMATHVPAPPVEDTPDMTECTWDDDILMTPTSCMLVTFKAASAGVLGDVPKERLDPIYRNPLLLLRDQALVDRLAASALPKISKEVFTALGSRRVHPFTRDAMMEEVLCFGHEDAHHKANKACLARLFHGTNMLVGNYAMWMVVMWYVLRNKEYVMEREVLDKYMEKFMMTMKVPAGLSSSGERPTCMVPVATAFLYCVHSTWMYRFFPHTRRDVMRDLHGVYDVLKESLRLVQVDVGSRYDDRIDTIRVVARVLTRMKVADAKTVWRECLEGIAQTLEIKGRVFVLDAPKLHISTREEKEFTVATMLKANPCVKLGDVVVPWDLSSNNTPFGVYGPLENEDPSVCDICPATLRPWTQVGGVPWEELAKRGSNHNDVKFSAHHVALKFVAATKKFPDPNDDDDVQLFLAMLEKAYGPVLPRCIMQTVKNILSQICDAISKRPDGQRSIDAVIEDIVMGYSRANRATREREWTESHMHRLS